VGYADLRLGSRVEPVIEALDRAGGGRFRGVRHNAARNPEVRMQAREGLLRDPPLREAFARLKQLGCPAMFDVAFRAVWMTDETLQ
jgi:L-fuconolactonase